jgi:hypothetical protein
VKGTGRRRAGEDNVRLRRWAASLVDDRDWYRRRLMAVTARCRALTAQAEITDGRLLLAEQLVQRQLMQLMALDSENELLRRQLKAASEDTQQIPIVTATEPELAGATT